jgi:DNA-binding transcriptional ArsR family regulator
MAERTEGRDAAVLAALAHPLRIEILRIAGESFSPKDVAVSRDESLGVVSYHVRALLDAGLIELTHTEPRRGAVQHFYRAVPGTAERLKAVAASLNELSQTLASAKSG